MSGHAQDLIGRHLAGTDGDVGKVKDLFFDDDGWTVRYLVVDTGSWLASREVLISPVSITRDDQDGDIQVRLDRRQVEQSPPVLSDAPVSRLYEEQLHNYYGWPYYWGGTAFGGPGLYMYPPIGDVGIYPTAAAREPRADTLAREERQAMEQRLADADPHLRSCKEVRGYSIHAADGEIGHVDDFVIDERAWVVSHLVVDTRNWLPGKRVTLETKVVAHIDWNLGEVCVGLTKAEIKDAPASTAGALDRKGPPPADRSAGSETLL